MGFDSGWRERQSDLSYLRSEPAPVKKQLLIIVSKLFSFFCIVSTLVILVLGFQVGLDLFDVPNLSFLENYNPIQTIQLFDIDDKPICSVDGTEKRILIKLDQVSPYMVKALLAAEDHTFFKHSGVSLNGIARALLSNFFRGKVVEGGSTITQQLAKNLFFEGKKRSIDLKIAELIIALSIEMRFSKEKILELYLNEIYFGSNAYGIEQASRTYFGKHASELDIAESAFLAGIIRAPSKEGAVGRRDASMARQQEVITKMERYGFLNPLDAMVARQEWVVFKEAKQELPKLKIPKYPYYVSAVIESLKGRYNSAAVERQGMKVYTNLDPIAQEAAERALSQGLARAPYGINQGALVSMRVSDAAVIALVGGVGDYLQNQWNCATNPHTAGSSFKPFVYLAGFERGAIDEYGMIEDIPLTITESDGKEYKPKNHDGKFMGGITIAKAFAYSRNIPALKIAQAVGISAVIQVARRAGINSNLSPHLSLALGCSAVSPLEMAAAYATFARGGVYKNPFLVRRVETRAGRLLETFTSSARVAFTRDNVAKLVDLMQDCVAEGTGQLAKLANRPVAGKTGTADQAKDLWFVGFTPDLSTAVWGGNRDNHAVGGSVTGGTVMARIWRNYNESYYKKVPTPAGYFVACNRAPAPLGDDKPIIKQSEKAAKLNYRSYSEYQNRGKKYSQKTYQTEYRRNAVQRAVTKSQRGVTEYNWSR